LGQAIMGKRSGDVVEYEAPGGLLKVEITDVGG
jgi:transcription elongation GreA/GreB family factor